ncbi:Flp pilus assembly complex ATPase component TadA [Salipaludibacillus sp. LMS25]|uniref:competence type IV pilus ATPase ComGA n=1 Tax=Salipaludibacillus sp. LMS25 TaxID=2924031 RepID=UPI0020D01896|nr:competence type IV pilus ATPase ComGA [Salipaludibacillus sp. LMS25]UTR14452.1 Flp pilus assembly complex ATPase component TadA [Salipaludibacillus sp. LMS25]
MDVIHKIHLIVNDALHLGASDIHFIPLEGYAVIRMRVDGKIRIRQKLPNNMMRKLISHLKFVSGMDIGERRRPQNRGLDMRVGERTIRMRLSAFPSLPSETLVMRLFLSHNFPIKRLALFPAQAQLLKDLTSTTSGLIIISGPTGVGKTTTLYSLLKERQNETYENVITLEDPIEQPETHFLQMEVNEKAGVTYATGLKNLLRHDPDIIMLGEVRDHETAKMAVRAALTGHLVVTTVHSSSATGVIKRLIDLSIPHGDLEEVLHAVVAQRLVQLTCPFCPHGCSLYCGQYRGRRRAALFEILYGEGLQSSLNKTSFSDNTEEVLAHSMTRTFNMAVALGYVHQTEHRSI